MTLSWDDFVDALGEPESSARFASLLSKIGEAPVWVDVAKEYPGLNDPNGTTRFYQFFQFGLEFGITGYTTSTSGFMQTRSIAPMPAPRRQGLSRARMNPRSLRCSGIRPDPAVQIHPHSSSYTGGSDTTSMSGTRFATSFHRRGAYKSWVCSR
jgi:hypothetical protein